jgi:hypothetical protein
MFTTTPYRGFIVHDEKRDIELYEMKRYDNMSSSKIVVGKMPIIV